MNIVVLDGYTLNPGDLDWSLLTTLGNVTLYERTLPEQTIERATGADAILTNKVLVTRDILEQLPQLKYIGILATGVNVVDLVAASERGVVVTNIPAYSTESVVQWTIGHLLNLASRHCESETAVHRGDWVHARDFCFYEGTLVELAGKTLGIIGFGAIGRRVAQVAMALKMKVVAYGPHLPVGENIDGVSSVALNDLYRQSDFISLHCPLRNENRGMINTETIRLMKPGAFIINTARGPLLDEQAVADALNDGRLSGVGLDVLSTEPPQAANPLLTAKNCYITPHNAWATFEARSRLMAIAAENLQAFIAGTPQNVVR